MRHRRTCEATRVSPGRRRCHGATRARRPRCGGTGLDAGRADEHPARAGDDGAARRQRRHGRLEAEAQVEGALAARRDGEQVAPGGNFGWHSHPGPSLVIVKSGTSTFYLGDDPTCTPEVHPAGTAYVDPGGLVHIARNESLSEDLVVIVTRLIPDGAAARIDQPAPGNC